MVPNEVKRPGRCTALVCGGRDFSDVYALDDILDRLSTECDDRKLNLSILQGGAVGADAFARQWAYHNGIHLITEPARWAKHGRAAGPIRNQLMLDNYLVDLCIAMPGGRGTADMVRRCQAAGVPIVPHS